MSEADSQNPTIKTGLKAEVGDSGPKRPARPGGANWGARAGQTIRGRLQRGGDGKFTSGGGAATPAPAPTTRRVPLRTPAKPQTPARKPASGRGLTAAQRTQRERERQADRAKREQERQARRAEQAQDRAKREVERQQDRQRREQERQSRAAAKPPKAGRQAGEGKQPAQSQAQARRESNRKNVLQALGAGGLSADAAETLLDLAGGGTPDESTLEALAGETGLVQKTERGYVLSTAGRSFIRALNTGNVEAARRALNTGAKKVGRKELRAAFYVFKDAKERLRWVMLSSNAYLDRDNEIISTQALSDDVARIDADGRYGPLRWWHVGDPDLKSYEAPWGWGLDIGDCDFNALSGRVLVESGTFRDERVGLAVAKAADRLQGSIGFIHPSTEPVKEDGAGVYYTIRRFERSLVPAGRAANPYTRLVVKGGVMAMVDQKKIEEFKALLGDNPELAQQLLETLPQSVERKALAEGAAFKSDGAGDGQPFLMVGGQKVPLNNLNLTVNTAEAAQGGDGLSLLLAALKAVAGSGGGATPPVEEEATEEVIEEDEGPGYVGDMLPDALAELIAGAVATGVADAIKPLAAMMNMDAKMEEIKGMFGGFAKKKEADDQAHQAQIAALEARIKALDEERAKADAERARLAGAVAELQGEVPRGLAGGGYRASQADDSVLGPGSRVKGAMPQEAPPLQKLVDFILAPTNQ